MNWFKPTKKAPTFETVVGGLRQLYNKNLRPLEDYYKFHDFYSPPMDNADFHSKPMVLLIGQYSTGKTTFIKYLLEEDFPGMRIGPEPTTDGFIAIMKGSEENGKPRRGVVPGNALVVDKSKPFRGLSKFGNNFLSRLQLSEMDNPVLNSLSIIDTPGILSGEKQRVDRGYDFCQVLTWFAERVDRIVLLFDAHKLDISDEFHMALKAIRGFDDKVRVILNKSDQVTTQQLMRVYGALMWSLGKVITTPEVPKVFIGSFWNNPLLHSDMRKLFEIEANDLFADLQSLPKHCALRKLNDLIKRARLAKVHALIIAHLAKNMPMFGKDKAKAKMMTNLKEIFDQISQNYNISRGDFPEVDKFREVLDRADWSKFKEINSSLLQRVDHMLSSDVPALLKIIELDEAQKAENQEVGIRGGVMENLKDNPFANNNLETSSDEWVIEQDELLKFNDIFFSLNPVNGKVRKQAVSYLEQSKLPNVVLGKIWKLADVDKTGSLDNEEFALACYLKDMKLNGHDLPKELPKHFIPPKSRGPEWKQN